MTDRSLATIHRVPRTYTAAEIADEAGCPVERVTWLSAIGLISPEDGRYSFGDVLSARMASALLENGVALPNGAGYGLSPYFRVSFASALANLEEACRRIDAAARALS